MLVLVRMHVEFKNIETRISEYSMLLPQVYDGHMAINVIVSGN